MRVYMLIATILFYLMFVLQDPELEARCEKLRKEQNNKEYRKMVQNVDKGQLVSSI